MIYFPYNFINSAILHFKKKKQTKEKSNYVQFFLKTKHMTSQIYSRVILDSYRKFTTDHAGENCTINKRCSLEIEAISYEYTSIHI